MNLRPFNRTALAMRRVALKFESRGPEWADRAREMRESADEIDPAQVSAPAGWHEARIVAQDKH